MKRATEIKHYLSDTSNGPNRQVDARKAEILRTKKSQRVKELRGYGPSEATSQVIVKDDRAARTSKINTSFGSTNSEAMQWIKCNTGQDLEAKEQ